MTQEDIDLKLKSLLDKDFLAKLTEVAKLYGWAGDYSEIWDFVADLHEKIDLEIPEDREPYEAD